mgnify:CR=1 FL=1
MEMAPAGRTIPAAAPLRKLRRVVGFLMVSSSPVYSVFLLCKGNSRSNRDFYLPMVLHGKVIDKMPSLHLGVQCLEGFDDLADNRFTFFPLK